MNNRINPPAEVPLWVKNDNSEIFIGYLTETGMARSADIRCESILDENVDFQYWALFEPPLSIFDARILARETGYNAEPSEWFIGMPPESFTMAWLLIENFDENGEVTNKLENGEVVLAVHNQDLWHITNSIDGRDIDSEPLQVYGVILGWLPFEKPII